MLLKFIFLVRLTFTRFIPLPFSQDFVKFNESCLQQLPCQISDPIPLGEGAGVGFMKGADSIAMPEGSTLFDLIQTGAKQTHAAVGVLVRLRQELSLVKDVPVLLAIDQVRYLCISELFLYSMRRFD